MQPILSKPAFYTHVLTGIALIVVILTLLAHRENLRLSLFQTILIILIIGILFGIHGLSHQGMDREYGYNPIEMIRHVVSPSPSPSSAGDALFMRTRA
jgi:L-cystine uptake protein TcyP (sodium:dicarboxylate symporter family)